MHVHHTKQDYKILTVNMTYLTNRFQVAARLFSNRSQMMSKCACLFEGQVLHLHTLFVNFTSDFMTVMK